MSCLFLQSKYCDLSVGVTVIVFSLCPSCFISPSDFCSSCYVSSLFPSAVRRTRTFNNHFNHWLHFILPNIKVKQYQVSSNWKLPFKRRSSTLCRTTRNDKKQLKKDNKRNTTTKDNNKDKPSLRSKTCKREE